MFGADACLAALIVHAQTGLFEAGDVAQREVTEAIGEQLVALCAIDTETDHARTFGDEVRAALCCGRSARFVAARHALQPH